MNDFDFRILLFMNRIADESPLVTKVVRAIYGDALKTAFVVYLLWWGWCEVMGTRRQEETRERIAVCTAGSIPLVVIVRALAALLPFRIRPISLAGSGLHFPITESGWGEWNAFPSDHAVLFF